MPNFVILILAVLFAIVIAALFMGAFAFLVKWAKRETKKLEEKNPQTVQTGTFFFENTKVLQKGIRNLSVGLRQPKCIVEFGVLFLTEENEEKFFLVSEEVYTKLQEGQAGTLVVTNGRFVDFGDGEEIEN